ncbi:MAG: glycoside hydrolase family 88 protein [Clostridiales bacterium]|nr:MAG: glycoside hydrolase family 88 protein [Clostridiales bacterium]
MSRLKRFYRQCGCACKVAYKLPRRKSGAWYQVVDKGYRDDNWIETSCTCLYIYGISNLVRRGLLGKEYEEYADKAYKEIIENQTEIKDGQLTVKNICIGTGVGDYEFYINRPHTQNDLHGTGAFTLMCTEYAAMKNR